MNGVSGPDGEDYSPWADRKVAQPKCSSPPQPQTKLSDSYSNTLPVRKSVTPKNSYATSKGSTGAGLGHTHTWGQVGGSEAHVCVQHPGDPFGTPSWTLGHRGAPSLEMGWCWEGISCQPLGLALTPPPPPRVA